jgi:hypothetical protein
VTDPKPGPFFGKSQDPTVLPAFRAQLPELSEDNTHLGKKTAITEALAGCLFVLPLR